MKPAPDAIRCEAGQDTCGAGQPLFETDGLIHCAHHSNWPKSKEGRLAAAVKKAKKEIGE